MDQERLRALAVPVLLQILQQVVLEISTRMMELEGGNGCGGGGGGNSYAGYGCGAHGDSSMAGGGGYTSTSSSLIAKTGAQEDTKLAINTTRAMNTEIVGIDAWMTSLL